MNSLIQDDIGPSFISFNLDLDRELLHITFDDVVNSTTLDPTKITFQQSRFDLLQLDRTNSYSLTGGYTNSLSGFVIDFVFNFIDVNELKSRPLLGNNVNDTFVSITASAIDDLNYINVIAIPPIEAVQSTKVYPDITQPQLVDFTFNLNSGFIILTFSEIIYLSTLDITQFTLVPFPFSDPIIHISLSGAVVFGMLYSRTVYVELSEIDLNMVKFSDILGTTTSDTFCIISSSLIFDVSDNPISPIFIQNPLFVSSFIPDSTSPNLISFSLDMNQGTLYLRFDEIVNVSTFDFSQIFLSNSNSNIIYSLTRGIHGFEVSNEVPFSFNIFDIFHLIFSISMTLIR